MTEPHVNETSTGGYLARERIPGDSYRTDPDRNSEIPGDDAGKEQDGNNPEGKR
ncbi:hypothetical protein [Amycolatopsis sp. NPDC004079]|uniref:hypothetical protein n=1 Tax=Amycolatopsis sp. NPDC004079 TaxID=3154549 RepID=UPI0033B80779